MQISPDLVIYINRWRSCSFVVVSTLNSCVSSPTLPATTTATFVDAAAEGPAGCLLFNVSFYGTTVEMPMHIHCQHKVHKANRLIHCQGKSF